MSASIVAGASSLAAATDANRTALWGLGPQGSLFYAFCPAGSEANPAAWSTPVPLVPSAEDFAFFLNLGAGNNVLFANVDGNSLIQLTQDPITTDWIKRGIVLPPTTTSDMAVFKSFTTHIRITDDSGIGVPNAGVHVTATSPVSVYLNDVYHILSPTVAVAATADATGVVTVVQETQSLSAVCFELALADYPDVVASVNPMTKALATLSTVQTGADLDSVRVTNADGSEQPLVPTGVDPGDTDAAAQSIAHFVKIKAGLPANGSRQSPTVAARLGAPTPARGLTVPSLWGVSFTAGHLSYHEGPDAAVHLGLRTSPAPAATPLAAEEIGGAVAVAAGDFFAWLQEVFDDVEKFFVKEVEGIYHFVATIAGKAYDVLLDCIAAVVHAVEFVLNRIKVFFDDLIKWLGFLFVWSDITRTHAVLKNIFIQYITNRIANLEGVRSDLQSGFTSLEKYIAGWGGIPANIPPSLASTTRNGVTGSSTTAPGQNSPQSNWGIYHLKGNAASGSTTATPNQGVLGDITSILAPLVNALATEKDVLQSAYTSFKTDIIDKIDNLSFKTFLEAVIAIIADALLESVENVVLAAIDVLVALTEGVVEVLNATIDIPIISSIYKQVTGDDLSLLDVACLVAAIPVTIAYKLITKTTPFPDNPTTQSLIEAPDFQTVRRICNGAHTPEPAGTEDRLLAATISASLNKILVLAAGISSTVGAVILSIFGPLKTKFPETRIFSIISGVFYVFYAAPDVVGQIPDLEDKKWWAIMNETLTDLMVVKAAVDVGVSLTSKDSAAQSGWNPVSPWLDFGGNIIWQVPTTAAIFDPENQNTSGILGLWAGTCFDCNGIMSPVLADDSEPVSWGIAVVVATVFNLAYGAMSCASSVLAFES